MSKVPFVKKDVLEVNSKASFQKYGILNEGPSRLMGNVTASTTLNVSGDTLFESNVVVMKSLRVEGLFIAANTSNTSNSNSGVDTDNLIVSRTSTLNGAVTAVSTLNVSGNTTLLNALTSMSTVNIKDNITATSNLNISGNTTIEGYIYGQSLDNITAGGTLNIGSSNASIINLGNGSGIQTVNIGTNGGGITTINIGGTGDIVNIAGSVNNIISTDLQVTDKLIALNKGSLGSGTARGAGFQIRDANDDNKAYFMINSLGTGYVIKPPEDTREVNFETRNFVDGLLKISGNTIFGSSIIDTEMIFNPNVTMTSNINVSGNSTFTGPVQARSTLNVSGNTIIQGSMTSSSTVNIVGVSTLNDTIINETLQVNKLTFKPVNSFNLVTNDLINLTNGLSFLNPSSDVTGIRLPSSSITGSTSILVNKSNFLIAFATTGSNMASATSTFINPKTTVFIVWDGSNWIPTRDA